MLFSWFVVGAAKSKCEGRSLAPGYLCLTAVSA